MTTSLTKSVRTRPESTVQSERTSGALQVPVRTQPEVLLDPTSSHVLEQNRDASFPPSSTTADEIFTDSAINLCEPDQRVQAFSADIAARSLVHLVDVVGVQPASGFCFKLS
jgi:hypothetical protein